MGTELKRERRCVEICSRSTDERGTLLDWNPIHVDPEFATRTSRAAAIGGTSGCAVAAAAAKR